MTGNYPSLSERATVEEIRLTWACSSCAANHLHHPASYDAIQSNATCSGTGSTFELRVWYISRVISTIRKLAIYAGRLTALYCALRRRILLRHEDDSTAPQMHGNNEWSGASLAPCQKLVIKGWCLQAARSVLRRCATLVFETTIS